MRRPYRSDASDHFVTLANQRRVRIRRLWPGEERLVKQLWEELSPRTRYFRTLSPVATLPDAVLRLLVSADDGRQLAFVAEDDSESVGEVVGLANFGALDDAEGELGLVVRDDWQRQGVGTTLAITIIEAAEARGFHRFIGLASPQNVAIRKLLKKVATVVSAKLSGDLFEFVLVRHAANPQSVSRAS